AAQPDQFLLEAPGVMSFGQTGDPLGGGREQDTMAGLAGPDRDAYGQMSLASARRPRKTTLSLAATKSSVPRWAMVSRLRPRAWSKSNSSNDFREGNRAARMRPSPPWDSRAETSRCKQATRNSSCVHDSARARSARRATASRIVGAFRARVKKVISAVRSRLVDEAAAVLAGVVLVVMTPTRLRRDRCPTRRRSQPATAAR